MTRELVGHLRMGILVVMDTGRDARPEGLFRHHLLAHQQRYREAEDAVEDIGEQRQDTDRFRHLDHQTLDPCRQFECARLLGGEQRRFLGDVLHQRTARHAIAQTHDQVLAVRHEHQVVLEVAVQQRRHVSRQPLVDPRFGADAGALDQRRQQGLFIVVDMQQRGHGHQALALVLDVFRALAPQAGQHLAIADGCRVRVFQHIIAIADGRDFTQQAEAPLLEGRVRIDQALQPLIDDRSGTHVIGRQAAHEAHVEDRQRHLHIATVRLIAVVERADRLLRLIAVLPQPETDDVLTGDLGGEGDRQLVAPLPRMHRHHQVVGGRKALLGQLLLQAAKLGFAQLFLEQAARIETIHGRVMGVVAMHGDPHQREGLRGFRRVGAIVQRIEAHAAIVGDEARMAFAHRRFQGLEGGTCQHAGGLILAHGALHLPGAGGERGADLLEIDRQQTWRNLQHVVEFQNQLTRVQRQGVAVGIQALDGGGIDQPVIELETARHEAIFRCAAADRRRVADLRRQRQAEVMPVVMALAGGAGAAVIGALRVDQTLVAELGQRLAHQQAIGLLPVRAGEMLAGRGRVGGHAAVQTRAASGQGGTEVLRGAEAQARRLAVEIQRAMIDEAHRGIQRMNGAIAAVRLHHHTGHGTDCIFPFIGMLIAELAGEDHRHDRFDHRPREAADGGLVLATRRDEEVHAEVAGLHTVMLAERVVRRVIELDQKGRLVIVETDPALGVLAVFQALVEVVLGGDEVITHAPEAGAFAAGPLIHHRHVGGKVERAQREFGALAGAVVLRLAQASLGLLQLHRAAGEARSRCRAEQIDRCGRGE